MKRFFMRTFALTEKGAKDLVRAAFANTLCSLILMGLSGLVYMFLSDALSPAVSAQTPALDIGMYILYAGILILILWGSYLLEYTAKYPPAYRESAAKRISLAETIRRLPLSFFGKKDLGDVTTTIMSDTTMIEQAFSHFIPDLVGSCISTLLIGTGLFVLDWRMGLATLWVVPVSVIIVILSKKTQDSHGKKSQGIMVDYVDKLHECIDNIKDIKSNNRKGAHKAQMSDKFDTYEKASMKGELVTGCLVSTAQLILKIGIATSMIMGVILLSSGQIDLLIFVLFMVVATRIFDPMSGALINIAAVFITMLSVNRMKELENTKIQTGKQVVENNGYDVEFKNVIFGYNEHETVLDGVSFKAKQGEVTALIGPSGGGKSTAIKLAARFWDVDAGSITLGGEDVSKVDPETLLEKFSIVFQDVTLFNNTVMENIRIGRKNATDEEVISAAKAANCHEFVSALPDGYNTDVGENGSKLSGGERQRLSIARALLKDAPIILLDEATSSLDIMNETALSEAIARLTKGKTVIVIAHRMRTIAGADKIVLLKGGKVAGIGNHRELISADGDYKKMVSLQTKSMTWTI